MKSQSHYIAAQYCTGIKILEQTNNPDDVDGRHSCVVHPCIYALFKCELKMQLYVFIISDCSHIDHRGKQRKYGMVYIFCILLQFLDGCSNIKYKLCTHITKCDLFNASLPCPHCCSPLCTGQACSSTVHCPPLFSTDHCAQCTCALLSVVLHSAQCTALRMERWLSPPLD